MPDEAKPRTIPPTKLSTLIPLERNPNETPITNDKRGANRAGNPLRFANSTSPIVKAIMDIPAMVKSICVRLYPNYTRDLWKFVK